MSETEGETPGQSPWIECLGLPNGAALRSADLHVHTPASTDMDAKGSGATPADVVLLALDAELEIIAVTDHNTVEWCQAVQDAAAGEPLVVLPGAEITTSEGHLLAIFDPGTAIDHLEDLLVRIGFPAKGETPTEASPEMRCVPTQKHRTEQLRLDVQIGSTGQSR